MLNGLYFVLTCVGWFSGLGWAAAPPALIRPGPAIPFIAALEHIQGIQVLTPSGATRIVRKAEHFKDGDKFLTGPRGAVWVDYANGLHILVGWDTLIQFGGGADVRGKDAPVIQVLKGDIRVLIDPPHGVKPKPPAAQPTHSIFDLEADSDRAPPAPVVNNEALTPIRLIIKTPHAWMGAHGTDFLVTVLTDETRLHTVHGGVSVASSVDGLEEKTALQTEAGEFTQAFLGKRGINKVRDFDSSGFVAKFHKRQPTLELLYTTVNKAVENSRITVPKSSVETTHSP